MNKFHTPVLVNQAIEYLNIKPGKRFIDTTIGGGGHTQAIVDHGGTVLGLDQDPDAVSFAKQRVHPTHAQVVLGNFTGLESIAQAHSFTAVSGIIFDLGLSSFQLDTPERGFSFQTDAPLDMRMSPDLAVTAADLVNGLGRKELYQLFTKLAQEPRARSIAEDIVVARRQRLFTTTRQLAELVEQVYGRRHGHLHPATKAFQALRIAVNDELNSLKAALPQALNLLEPGGRLVVISFHEGEDRIVKHQFKHWGMEQLGTILTPKPVTPTSEEIRSNPRARSAKLRTFEKL